MLWKIMQSIRWFFVVCSELAKIPRAEEERDAEAATNLGT
jgi:hypothetical protein